MLITTLFNTIKQNWKLNYRIEAVISLDRYVPAFGVAADALNEGRYGRDEPAEPLTHQVRVEVNISAMILRDELERLTWFILNMANTAADVKNKF